MKKVITIVALIALTISAHAGKGAEQLTKQPTPAPIAVAAPITSVVGGAGVNSSLKSRGFVGPYEIVAHRERGFFGPSTVETFVYNSQDGSLAVINPANSPGVGIAVVNGGALVGASYLFGHSLRPDQTTVQQQTGATTATGGAATGGTGTGNGGAATGTGGTGTGTGTGHQHPASPGNGGIPGNGHGHNRP